MKNKRVIEEKSNYSRHRSKDNSDPAIQKQRLESARELYNKELEEKIDRPSIFSRATSYLNNLLIVQPMNSIKNAISVPINAAMSFINPILENPIVTIATSTPASRAITMAFGASAVTACCNYWNFASRCCWSGKRFIGNGSRSGNNNRY
ncbi:MAG: hypothetical protein RCG15_00920 [Candidatus Rickettsia vulgarisii]